MKFETFKSIILELKRELDESYKFNRELSKVLGGDSYVVRENPIIDNTLKILSEEFNDHNNWIDWFFWENIANNSELEFQINNNSYKGNFENIWKMLNNEII